VKRLKSWVEKIKKGYSELNEEPSEILEKGGLVTKDKIEVAFYNKAIDNAVQIYTQNAKAMFFASDDVVFPDHAVLAAKQDLLYNGPKSHLEVGDVVALFKNAMGNARAKKAIAPRALGSFMPLGAVAACAGYMRNEYGVFGKNVLKTLQQDNILPKEEGRNLRK
jgi:hypothetical protein